MVTEHAFRNALLPLITVIGLSLPWLIGGSVVMESIFGWPGLGTYGLRRSQQRDYPVIMGVNFVAAIVVLGAIWWPMLRTASPIRASVRLRNAMSESKSGASEQNDPRRAR